jgi:hypothetical protein
MKREINQVIDIAIGEMGANIPGKRQQQDARDKDISEARL